MPCRVSQSQSVPDPMGHRVLIRLQWVNVRFNENETVPNLSLDVSIGLLRERIRRQPGLLAPILP